MADKPIPMDNVYSIILEVLMNRLLLTLTSLLLAFSALQATEECCGKIELAPVYMTVDMIEARKTAETMQMWGGRLDISINIWKGILFRPSVIVTTGDGELNAETVGLGFAWKATDQLLLIPSIGYTHSGLSTKIHPKELPGYSFNTHFRSDGGVLGLEAHYTFVKDWRVSALIQYGWSATVTKIKNIGTHKGHSQGGNYALGIEHDFNPYWSINLVGAYNSSLSHEKDGLRAYGAKLGITRWLYW